MRKAVLFAALALFATVAHASYCPNPPCGTLNVAATPSQTVSVGDHFDVSLDVTAWEAPQSNTWEVVIAYDPSVIALSGNAFSLGSLTTGTGCGTFGQSGTFGMPAGHFYVNATLLGQCSMHSAGRIVTFHFTAIGTGATTVTIPNPDGETPSENPYSGMKNWRWYDAGYYVPFSGTVTAATITVNGGGQGGDCEPFCMGGMTASKPADGTTAARKRTWAQVKAYYR